MIAFGFLLLFEPPRPAAATTPDRSDIAEARDTNHGYARLDTLPPVDTVQPRLRLGAVGRFHYANAQVDSFSIDPVATPGAGIALRAEMEFLDPLYFFIEVGWMSRNQQTWLITSSATPIQYDFNLSYIHVPLLFELQIPVADNLTATGAFGAAPSFLIARSRRVVGPESDTVLSLDKGFNIFDFGLEGRVGFEMAIDSRTSVSVGASALIGQQNLLILQSGADDRSWRTRSWGIAVGLHRLVQKAIRRDRSAE